MSAHLSFPQRNVPRPRVHTSPTAPAPVVQELPAVETKRPAHTKFTLKPYLQLLRIRQWIKNIAVLLIPLATLGNSREHVSALAATVVVFIFASSGVYVFNDLLDVERDRAHPEKHTRPLASGKISLPVAAIIGLTLTGCVPLLAADLPWPIMACALSYLTINFLYCLWLKHVPILELLAVSSGFVLRAAAGACAAHVAPSGLILGAVGAASLTLVVGKRRAELVNSAEAIRQRPVLARYDLGMLDAGVLASAICAIGLYLAYLTASVESHAQSVVVALIVLVTLGGLMRFLQTTLGGDRSAENPTRLLATDFQLLLLGGAWMVLSTIMMALRDAGL
jgi:decaprenyl-phosphate phosphoribosyltransferase